MIHERRRGRVRAALVAVILITAAAAAFLLLRGARHEAHAWHAEGISMGDRLKLFRMADSTLFGPTRVEADAMVERASTLAPQGRAHALFAAGKAYLRRGALDEAVTVLTRLTEDLSRSNEKQAKAMRAEAIGLMIGAQLRRAEATNCLANHNADSCLLPIQGGGVHTDKAPMTAAVETIRSVLAENPDDLLARWLLNVSAMTLGTWPAGVEERWRISPEAFASDAPFPRFPDVASAVGVAVEGLSGSPILEDFDGDGDIDVATTSMGLNDPLRLFLNDGQGGFTDHTRAAGLSKQLGGLNCCQADYDNDGDVDILVLRGGWMGNEGDAPNSLLRNRGDGTFEDATLESGILTFHGTQVSAWADYDLDGWLDLFIGNESTEGTGFGHPSSLFHNQRDGTFVDVADHSGLDLHAFTKGATWGDYDDDGDPDLFVSRRDGPSRLYRNDTEARGGHAPRFVDVTRAAGIEVDRRDFPCWFFDYDNDGLLDLFVGGYDSGFSGDDEESPIEVIPRVRLGLEIDPVGYPQLWRNRGDGTFEDVAEKVGLHRVVLLMGSNFGDLDGDGWPDLYLGTGHPDFRALMANRAFRNDGGRAFQDVTTAAGMGHLQKGHGIAFGDVDGDGDQDVYATLGGWFPSDTFPNALYENPGNENRWITLRLEGRTANRFAVGARIALTVLTPAGERTIHHLVGSGGSFGSSTLQAEIGLGDALSIQRCTIRWPGGEEQLVEGLEPDGVWRVVEGAAPVAVESKAAALRRGQAGGHGSHGHH